MNIHLFSIISTCISTSIYCPVELTPRGGGVSVDINLFSTISTYTSTSIYCPVELTRRGEGVSVEGES